MQSEVAILPPTLEPKIDEVKPFTAYMLENGLSLQTRADGFGIRDYQVSVTLDDEGPHAPVWDVNDGGQQARAALADGLELEIKLLSLPLEGQYEVQMQLINRGKRSQRLHGIAFGQFSESAQFIPGTGHVLGWATRYAHTGNLRTERYPFCAADYPYVRQLPTEQRILGDTEDQPFPALFIGNDVSHEGIVFGFSEQQRAVPVFAIKRKPLYRPDALKTLEIRWHFPQSSGYDIAPGSRFILEPLYLQIKRPLNAANAFEDYLDHLAKRTGYSYAEDLSNKALHCTWNYGVFADQREATLINTARFIANNLPQIRYFLIDDGYLTHHKDSTRVFLNRFYPEPSQAAIDPISWPQGIRGFTDTLRQMGLRPGIWWTPMIKLPCRLHDEHPEWFLRKPDGNLFLIGKDLAYLDYSHPDALDFLDRTLAHIQGDWGIDAVKIDFWSQNFETNQARLHRPNCSGVEMRRAFFETVRRHLPQDGIIMSCIAMGMGNPFLSEFVDTFRCSMDISDGLWDDQVNNACWMLPTLSFGGRRLGSLLNTDSVGFNPDLPDNETLFRLTWCTITMGLIETGGRLEQLDPEQLAALKKILVRCDRGYPCLCPDAKAFSGDPHPDTLYVDFPEGSPTKQQGISQSVALFNWHDTPRAITIDRQALGHTAPVIAEDFWTGKQSHWREAFITHIVHPRSALLFDIHNQKIPTHSH